MASYLSMVIFQMLAAASLEGAAFDVQRHDANRLRIHLGEDEALILPRKYAIVRPPAPKSEFQSIAGDKFYPDLSRLKKPPKYMKPPHPLLDKLKPAPLTLEDHKGYDEDSGYFFPKAPVQHKHEVPFESLFRPIGIVGVGGSSLHGYADGHGLLPEVEVGRDDFQDVKPVTEHIEGDLKYDFRTKTHSI